MAGDVHVLLREWQGLAGRDAQLQLDEVETRHRFGHRVLHLQARVHFHEPVLAFGVEQEFERARAFVGDGFRRGDGGGAHAFAQCVGHRRRGRSTTFWRRRCTEQSRFAKVNGVAMPVGEHLTLDVARRDDGALREHRPNALSASDRARGCIVRVKSSAGCHEPHAAPAAARSQP